MAGNYGLQNRPVGHLADAFQGQVDAFFSLSDVVGGHCAERQHGGFPDDPAKHHETATNRGGAGSDKGT